MNIFTFFCAPASTINAHRCIHCNEHHTAPQQQRTQQLWPNYGYLDETERFAAPVVLGFQYIQQPSHHPLHHPSQQPPFSHPPQPTPATMPPTPSTTNLYTLLDLPPTALPSTIKTSYHRLALLTHPDKNPDDPKAAERFKALSAAYAIISNPKTRAIYDKHGKVAAGRAEAFDDEGNLVGGTGGQEMGGEKGEGVDTNSGGRNVSNPPSGQFEGSEVEQSTYEDTLLDALRAAHAREVEEERRARAGRLYERFWRGVRGGNSGGGVWGWTTRAGEPMGEPMMWRRASMMGNSMMYSDNGGWAAGTVDEGLRERFQRGRGEVEWSPYAGWERVGEGYGRFRGWSEGGGGGFVRFVGDGYGGGYGRY